MLRDWQEHRGIRPHVKVFVLILLPLVITASIVFGRLPLPLAILLIVLGLIGATVVLSLRTPCHLQPATTPPTPPDPTSEALISSQQPCPLAADPLQRQQTHEQS